MEKGKNIPLHQRVQHDLAAQFADMEYFAPLPGERELCQRLEVSRPTVRRALASLEQDGLITRIQGRGSFYVGNKVPIDYSAGGQGLGLFQVLSMAGKFTKSQVIQQVAEVPDGDIAACLQLADDELVFHLKRRRYVNGELYSLADDYVPLRLCPQLLETDFSSESLFKTLERNHVIPYREEKTIEVKRANVQEAAYLNLQKGEPISLTRIITYDADANIIQYATSRADAYKSRFKIISSAGAES